MYREGRGCWVDVSDDYYIDDETDHSFIQNVRIIRGICLTHPHTQAPPNLNAA